MKAFIVLLSLLFIQACASSPENQQKQKDLTESEQNYVQIGYNHLSHGNTQMARTKLLQALEINKRSSGAHLGLAKLYQGEGANDVAEGHYKKAIEYGENSEAHFQYGLFLNNKGQFDQAIEQLEKANEDLLYIRRAEVYQYMGLIESNRGDSIKAIEYFDRSVNVNSMNGSGFLLLANEHLRLNQPQQGMKAFNSLVELIKIDFTEHNAASLWIGIQLSASLKNTELQNKYAEMLFGQFSNSKEFKLYQDWVN